MRLSLYPDRMLLQFDFFQEQVDDDVLEWVGMRILVLSRPRSRDQGFELPLRKQPWNVWLLPFLLWLMCPILVSQDQRGEPGETLPTHSPRAAWGLE